MTCLLSHILDCFQTCNKITTYKHKTKFLNNSFSSRNINLNTALLMISVTLTKSVNCMPTGKHIHEMYIPVNPNLYRKTGVCRGTPNFLVFDSIHTLWVRMYVLNKNIKYIKFFLQKFSISTTRNLRILHGCVFVMEKCLLAVLLLTWWDSLLMHDNIRKARKAKLIMIASNPNTLT